MRRIFYVFLFLYFGCSNTSNVQKDLVITGNVIHEMSDFLPILTFPPRAISLSDNKYFEWMNLLRQNGALGSDSVLVDEEPKPIHYSFPEYPDEARSNSKEGVVYLRVWVNSNGTVRKAMAVASSDTVFVKASLKAGMGWQFSPAMINGKPIEVSVFIPFHFKLNKN